VPRYPAWHALNVPALQIVLPIAAVLGGRDFIFHNDADRLFLERQMASFDLHATSLLVIVFLTRCEMFGTTAGFVALAVLLFDPNTCSRWSSW